MIHETTRHKKNLRKEITSQNARLFRSERKAHALAVTELLLKDQIFLGSKTIALFASKPDEPDTDPIFELCLQLGKVVYFPRVSKEDLEFVHVKSKKDLRLGSFGVLEPLFGKEIASFQIDFLLVPAVAFDAQGFRLGRGKGFYDRVLTPLHRAKHVVGLGFSHQIVENLPKERHDERVDRILTEKGWR